MITVVIPAFNAHADLPRALTSIRLQTFTDWQCIVVDDGSPEPLAPIVEAFADPRIRVIRHPVNRGRGAARVTGLAAVTTPLIAWQDADDWSYPERLERELEAMQATGAPIVASMAAVADKAERVTGLLGRDRPEPHRLGRRERNAFTHPTLLFRREVLDRVPYRSKFRTSEDHDFMMWALREFDYVEIADVLYVYREEQSRSLRKYYESTRTRMEVAATLTCAPRVDRVALMASHLTKLVLVTGAEVVGRRALLANHAQVAVSAAVLAHHDACVAQLAAALKHPPR